MTLQVTLDEIARLQGWANDISGWGFGPGGWVKPCRNERGEIVSHSHCLNGSHPIPATLDAIAGLMPRDYCLSIRTGPRIDGWEASAMKRDSWSIHVVETAPTELEARAALLLAVLRREKEARL